MSTQQEILQNNLEKIKQWFEEYDKERLKTFTELYEPQIKDFVVYMPLLGEFSAGKSTLLNVFAGEFSKDKEELLKTASTRETAVPAELFYSESPDIIACYGNEQKTLTRDDLKDSEKLASICNGKNGLVKIGINNDEWKKFRHIHLVDLPGLGSDVKSHDNAIKNYLSKALGFILVAPIQIGTLPNDTKEFLDKNKYLIERKPIILIFTKCSSTPDQNVIHQYTKELKKVIGENEIKTLTFGKHGLLKQREAIIKDFSAVLIEMEQQDLGKIFAKNIAAPVIVYLREFSRDYIEVQANQAKKDFEDLEKEKKKKEEELKEIQESTQKAGNELENNVRKAISEIKKEVKAEYLNNVENFYSVATSSGESELKSKIDNVINSEVRNGIHKYYQETIKDFLREVSDNIPSDLKINTSNLKTDITKDSSSDLSVDDLGVLGSGGMALLTQAIPAVSRFLGPVGVVASIALPLLPKIISWFTSNAEEQEKRIRMRDDFQNKLRAQAFDIEQQVESALTEQLLKNANEIKNQFLEKIQKDIQQRQNQIAELQKNLNNPEKMKMFENIQNEIEKIINDINSAEQKIN